MPATAKSRESKTQRFVRVVDKVSDSVGKVVAYIILIIMLITTFEVVARYFFDRPTSWVWPIDKQLFGVMILFGGSYAMMKGSHIRIEILHSRFSPPWLRISKWLSLFFSLAFLGILVWQSGSMAWTSIQNREVSIDVLHMPVYPFKALFPVAAFLFLLQGIAQFLRREEPEKANALEDSDG